MTLGGALLLVLGAAVGGKGRTRHFMGALFAKEAKGARFIAEPAKPRELRPSPQLAELRLN